jgi:hypothetical protein
MPEDASQDAHPTPPPPRPTEQSVQDQGFRVQPSAASPPGVPRSGCHAHTRRQRRPVAVPDHRRGRACLSANARQTLPNPAKPRQRAPSRPIVQNEPTPGTRHNSTEFDTFSTATACASPAPRANRTRTLQPPATPCNQMQPHATTRKKCKTNPTPSAPSFPSCPSWFNAFQHLAPDTPSHAHALS